MEVKVFVSPSPVQSGSGWMPQREFSYGQRVTPPSTASRNAAQTRTSGVPGRSDFLHLLTTQLKYQDPLSPVKDHEFIAQLAQFSTLEELQGLNRRMDELAQLQLWVSGMSQATNLIGRSVTLELPDGTTVTGTVSAVRMRDGVPYLQVGDREYIVTSVTQIN